MTSGIWVLVPAAGTGSRMGADRPKQYLPLADTTVLSATLTRLSNCPVISGVLLGIAPNDAYWPDYAVDTEVISKLKDTFIGGQTRAETVLRGCQSLLKTVSGDDWVLVHDAARPCVRIEDIDRLVQAVQNNKQFDGGLLGLPVSDTVKRTDGDSRVLETVPRAGLWRALTPQMFRVSRLYEALQKAEIDGIEVTDEAQAMENIGAHVHMVEGSADNIKITHPGDISLAERYLEQQKLEQA